MNCMRGFTDLKEQRQLYYEPACQKDIKEGDNDLGSGDHKARCHPTKIIVCTYKGNHTWVQGQPGTS